MRNDSWQPLRGVLLQMMATVSPVDLDPETIRLRHEPRLVEWLEVHRDLFRASGISELVLLGLCKWMEARVANQASRLTWCRQYVDAAEIMVKLLEAFCMTAGQWDHVEVRLADGCWRLLPTAVWVPMLRVA